jgi:predicted flap endonuclease-1-like 5' DNA nuclease
MSSKEQTGSSMVMTGVLAAVPAIAGFGVLKVVGGFDNWTAVLLSILIFLAVAVFLVNALHRADPGVTRLDALPHQVPAPAPVPPAAPAAKAPAPAAPRAAPAAPLMQAASQAKPQGLTAARGGKPDDLKEIVGVGPVLEKLLHKLGFFHFDQVGAWTASEIAWVDENLEGFKGRVTRDNWVPQARDLAARKR